ncbi:M43 family zinc metalloprotease [Hymenobacter sp. H14-R3]|uniref:M43 family zinc metalloprotease n=1 Tax=Hymenobacter sp. H14-R3 TaxID=3046308 RepID=UPI0024BADCD1|nr:M43 family zinc metalloprotease [Hymenobacter sp. H14-R3]
MWNHGVVLVGVWLAMALLGARPVAAQKLLPSPGPRTCATQAADDWQQAALRRKRPGYSSAKLAGGAAPLALRTAAVTYTLPVVVHIISDGEAVGAGTNISQAQVQSQLDVLNEDYRNLNADGALVPSPFQPLRADAQFQFALAQRDPRGATMPEPGIDRVSRTAKGFDAPPYSMAYIDGTIKPGTDWDPSQYVNIWVLDLGGRLLGYAQFPDNTANLSGLSPLGGTAETDGVVILYSAFGRVGTLSASYNKGRTLTHELGHWLGLRHIWGDDNCGDDYCLDTPTQQTGNTGCPNFPHVTCSNGPTGDMFMNYMDYVNDACMQLFSADQKARMQAVMAVGTARRASLTASPALCTSVLRAIATNSGAACPGSTTRLLATGPAGATYLWNGPNGYTSTQQNPVLPDLTAASAGIYTVTVSNTSGACPGTARTTVAVSPAPPKPVLAPRPAAVCVGGQVTLSTTNLTVAGALPSEDFNGTAPGWSLASTGLASTAWQLRPAPFTYASQYVALTSYSLDGSRFALANSDVGGVGSSTNTTLTSPVFSTTGYSSLQVVFQHYYRNDPGDQATVEVSTNGGTSWATVATYFADQGTAAAPALATLDLGAYLNQPRVQLRWHYAASWGYFWALDNVVVTGTPATYTYAWSLVSGDGLPAATTTPTLTVTPTQSSVYRLTLGAPGLACTASDTIGVRVTTPTWTGATGNGNWFDAANWAGCVPTRLTDALIPAGRSTPYPTIGSGVAEVRTLTQQGGLTLAAGELALYGDYLGTGPLTQTGGTVATRGTSPQSLRPTTYQTLLIGGTGPKTIGAATITQALTMAGPILTTGINTLTISSIANISETDASYVMGRVQTTRTLGTDPESFGGLGLVLAPAYAPGATTVVRTTGQPQGTAGAGGIGRYFDITAATSRGLQGTTLTQQYLPHELNDLAESQLTAFRSTDGGATWSNEGATQREAAARTVARAYVTDLQGRWTLASTTAPLAPAPLTYAINAFPVPFGDDGLSIQVTTPTAGPLTVQLYDVLGRVIYNHSIAMVEVGTSTVRLPGSGQLRPAKYVLLVQQAAQTARLNVVRQ